MVGSLSGSKARLRVLPGLVALMGLLSGCAAVQSNVRGGFACGAPGGTCAPSATIDDTALAAMHRSERMQAPWHDKAEGADLVLGDDPAPEEGAVIVKAMRAPDRNAAVDRSAPRFGQALKIVYPAYQDREGHAHPRHLAYALVDTSAWAAAFKGRGNLTASVDAARPGEGLLGAALHALPLGLLGRDAMESALPANPPAAVAQGQGAGAVVATPDLSVVGTETPAPSAGKSASPTAQIEAEVSALLARRKAASAGIFSGKVE